MFYRIVCWLFGHIEWISVGQNPDGDEMIYCPRCEKVQTIWD